MKHRGFAGKLILSYLVLAVIPLLILLAIVIAGSMATTGKQAQFKLDSAAALTEAQLDSLLETMEIISLNVMCSENFISASNGLAFESGRSSLKERDYYKKIEATLCSYSYVGSAYRLIYFNNSGHYVDSENYNDKYDFQYRLPKEELEALEWKEEADTNYGRTILLPVSDSAIPQSESASLTLVRAVRNPGKVTGYLAVQIRLEDLAYIFEVDEISHADIMVQSDGRIIYATDGFPEELYFTASGEELQDKYLFSEIQNRQDNFTVTRTVPLRITYENVYQTILSLLLEGILILALTIIGILIFSRQLSLPLVTLGREMRNTTLETLHSVSNKKIFARYEETKNLYEEFIQMRQRLDRMTRNEIDMKMLHMQEVMRSLQGSIHPHFLYNTLNVIGIMGAEAGEVKIYDACRKLSGILRYSISDKNSSVSTIREETENVQLYLELMKLRFEDRVQYEIHCEERIGEQQVLRLILQPFAENIFEHAFDSAHIYVEIKVKGYEENGYWVISMEDNGAGIHPKILHKIQSEVADLCENTMAQRQCGRESIGISNTILRLWLFYKGEFKYRIENKETGGTRIVLSGPMEDQNGYVEKDASADCGG